jgi:hypothetical protein
MKAVFTFNDKKKSSDNDSYRDKAFYTEVWGHDELHTIDILNHFGSKFIDKEESFNLNKVFSYMESEKWGEVISKKKFNEKCPYLLLTLNDDLTLDYKDKEDPYKRKIFLEEIAFKKKYGDKRQWFFDSIENYYLENQDQIPKKIENKKIQEKRNKKYEKVIKVMEEKRSELEKGSYYENNILLPSLDLVLDTAKKINGSEVYNLSLGKRVLRIIEVIEDEEHNFESKNDSDFYFAVCYLKKMSN